MASNKLVRRWATDTLRGLGIKPNAKSVGLLIGWQRAEGGHTNNDARYNFLNTTQSMPGAGNTGTQGNIKVYKSYRQGVKATVKTLKNGRYGGIIDALGSGDKGAFISAIGNSPWGTGGGLVAQTVRGQGPVKPAGTAMSMGESSPSRASGGGSRPGSYTIPGIDNSAERKQLKLDYLQDRHDPDALLTLAYGLKGAQDTASKTVQIKGSGGTFNSGGRNSRVAAPGKLDSILAEANLLDAANNAGKLPYQWGGGHAGKIKPGSKATPVDCSGAVSRLLGINPRVASQFMSWGKPGRGKRVTIYAKGDHVLMQINGRFFGTSRSNPGGGAGWIPASAVSKSYLSQFTARHPPGL